MSPPPLHLLLLLFLENMQETAGGSDKDKLKDSPGLGVSGGSSNTRPFILIPTQSGDLSAINHSFHTSPNPVNGTHSQERVPLAPRRSCKLNNHGETPFISLINTNADLLYHP